MQTDFRLGKWTIRPRLERIERGDEVIHVHPKPMAVLECLAAADGEVVTREELFESVWPGVIVTDDALTQCIVELRKAFGDSPRDPQIIKTIPKVGFCLVPPIKSMSEEHGFSQRKTVAGIAVISTVVLIFVLLANRAWWIDHSPEPGDPPVSVAVMPFADLSEGQDQEYFADGISEELSNSLAHVDGLRVTGRTSSFFFKGKNEDLRKIGEALGVSHVLEGSVRKEGANLRITAQLIDVADGFHLWSEAYDYNREITGNLVVQQEISRAVVAALEEKLGLRLGAMPEMTSTASSAAHDAFLLGRYLLAQRTPDNVQGAVQAFEKAVELDPDYAIAHAELSMAVFLSGYYNPKIDLQDLRPKVTFHAERAMALDPDLAEAHAAMARFRGSTEKKLEYYQQAIRINPSYSIVHTWMGAPLNSLGRYREAYQAQEAGLRLDPLSIPAIGQYVSALMEKMRLAEAGRELDKLAFLKPDSYARMKGKLASVNGKWAHWALGALDGMLIDRDSYSSKKILARRFATMGMDREALLIQDPPQIFTLMILGRHDEAAERAKQWLADSPDIPHRRSYMGRTLVSTGDHVTARSLLEEAWLTNGQRVTRNDIFSFGDAAALITLRREAGEGAEAEELLAAMRENVSRLKEAGFVGYGHFTSIDFAEGLTRYMSGDRDIGLALIERAVEKGYFIPPPSFYPQALYDDPDFAPIRDKQEANQARERERFLAVVCDRNPYREVWQPEKGTCEKYFAMAVTDEKSTFPNQFP